jgi:hypothetical protein
VDAAAVPCAATIIEVPQGLARLEPALDRLCAFSVNPRNGPALGSGQLCEAAAIPRTIPCRR